MISSQLADIKYTVTTLGAVYSFPNYFLAEADLAVDVTGIDGVDRTLVLNTDYTVSGAGVEAGGSVTLTNDAAAVGESVTIYRNGALEQPAEYPASGQFPASTTELSQDRLTMLVQQLKAGLNRALRLPMTASGISPLSLAARAGKLLGFDTNGDVSFIELDSGVTGATNNLVLATDSTTYRSLGQRFGEIVNVKDWGALGNGLTDDSAAVQAAVDYATVNDRSVYFPPGQYRFGAAVNVTGGVRFFSDAQRDNMTRIISGANSALFAVTGQCEFSDLCFVGQNDDTKTSQVAISITSTNNVAMRRCFFINNYDHIRVSGTCFYTKIDSCEFYNARRAWVYGVSATPQGMDFMIVNTHGSSNNVTQQYGFYFDGLGSIILGNCVFSPSFPTVALFYVQAMATLAGTQNFANSVFESNGTAPAFWLKGTALLPCRFFKFANCNIGGGGALAGVIPAVLFEYAHACSFTSCYITGPNIGFNTAFQCTHLCVTDTNFEVVGLPIAATYSNAGADVTVFSCSILNPTYTGTNHFLYLPNLTDAQLDYATVIGGVIGTGSPEVYTSSVRDVLIVARGSILSSSFNGIGYRLGSGASVTQLTSKSTTVTCSTITGEITMHNASLASGAKVAFAVLNSVVTADDLVSVSVKSGGTANAYRASVCQTASGSFNILVENVTGGALAESPILRFAVIKSTNT